MLLLLLLLRVGLGGLVLRGVVCRKLLVRLWHLLHLLLRQREIIHGDGNICYIGGVGGAIRIFAIANSPSPSAP